jgi:hypothetical protein
MTHQVITAAGPSAKWTVSDKHDRTNFGKRPSFFRDVIKPQISEDLIGFFMNHVSQSLRLILNFR